MEAFSRETLGTSVFINLQQSLFPLNDQFGVSTFFQHPHGYTRSAVFK